MFPVDLLPAKPQTAQLRGKRLSPFKPPPELLAVKRPVKPLPGMSDPSVRKELPVTEISYAADDTEDNNVLSTADSQSYTTADRKLKTRAGRTARKESSESEPLESGPGSVLRAARRSLQEISRVATASRPLRRSVASEKTIISRGPENIDFGPAGADKGWIDAGSTATQLSQFTNPAEDDGKKPEEKSLAAMLEYVPTQDIARRLVASIDEFERDFTTSQHRCEEGEPHPIANRIVCDSAVTAAALRDASGLSGRSSVVISLYQLQKGMNTPPSELPLRFYQEKVVPLGLDTDAAIVRGKGDAGPQPKWDPKSKQWKMLVVVSNAWNLYLNDTPLLAVLLMQDDLSHGEAFQQR